MRSEIKKIKEHFQTELREKFDEEKFNADVRSGKSISHKNLNEYKKDEKDVSQFPDEERCGMIFGDSGLFFRATLQNGEYLAIGSNGHLIRDKDIDSFHRKLAKVFKVHCLKHGKEPFCRFTFGKKAENKTAWSESFARVFINTGVVIDGCVPKSPEFWRKMKADYLSQKGHNLATWNRLTRFVPIEYKGDGKNFDESSSSEKSFPSKLLFKKKNLLFR